MNNIQKRPLFYVLRESVSAPYKRKDLSPPDQRWQSWNVNVRKTHGGQEEGCQQFHFDFISWWCNYTFIFPGSSRHCHTQSAPGGETNVRLSLTALLQNSTHVSLQQDMDVLNFVSFRADTARVTDTEGDKTAHQVLILVPVTAVPHRHNSGPALSLLCCA